VFLEREKGQSASQVPQNSDVRGHGYGPPDWKGGTVARFELTIPIEEARLRGFEEHDPRGRLVTLAWSQARDQGIEPEGDPVVERIERDPETGSPAIRVRWEE
jgi:hypothetical protein